jgi:hypothetical protein
MKRSTWLAVLVTAGVLVVAGNLPRLPLDAFAASWQAAVSRSVAAWPRAARRTFAPPFTPRSYAHAPLAAPARPARRALVAVAPARLLATPAPAAAVRRGFALPSFPALPLQVALPALAPARSRCSPSAWPFAGTAVAASGSWRVAVCRRRGSRARPACRRTRSARC